MCEQRYMRIIVGATNGPWVTKDVCSHNKWPDMCRANRTEKEKCKQSNMVGKSDRTAEWQVTKCQSTLINVEGSLTH